MLHDLSHGYGALGKGVTLKEVAQLSYQYFGKLLGGIGTMLHEQKLHKLVNTSQKLAYVATCFSVFDMM